MQKKLILFYLPGTGGHHLANLIALSGDYVYPVNYDRYQLKYATGMAHFDNHDTLRNTIYHYHFGQCNDHKVQSLLEDFYTKCLVISSPVKNQLAWDRINGYNRIIFREYGFYHDLAKIYKQQYLSKIYPTKDQCGWLTVDCDVLFDRSSFAMLVEQLEQDIGITIPNKPLAQTYHNLWLDSIEDYVNSLKTDSIDKLKT